MRTQSPIRWWTTGPTSPDGYSRRQCGREVRVEDAALEAVANQLVGSLVAADRFVAEDLVREVRFLEEHYDILPLHGPGGRHTQHEPETVALFHVFASLDDDGTVAFYHVDVWIDEPPAPPEDF